MLRTVIIGADLSLAGDLESVLAQTSRVGLLRVMTDYPSASDLARFVRVHSPQLVLLSAASLDGVKRVLETLEQLAPGVQVIAVHTSCEPQLLMELMRLGVREFLSQPFDRAQVAAARSRAKEQLERRPVVPDATDRVYSFLPSKAGSGATTIAVNTAFAIAQRDLRTLLADFDLSSGIVRFALKLDNAHCIADAVEYCRDMDESMWPQLVTAFGSLDVLHAGRLNPNLRIEPSEVARLLSFARRNYQAVVVDLSGNLEKYAIEIMHESKRIFLVCTAEMPSLHLAREKYQYLCSLDLGDRVSLLLNRCGKRMAVSQTQVEELLGLPVEIGFPNEYSGIMQSLADGRPARADSEMGLRCAELAANLLGKRPAAEIPKKRFVEYFSLTPAKYSFEARR